jgi:hypothetical protein
MTAKPPTPQGISALLKRAGFERSVSSATRIKGWRNYSEGYSVTGYRDEVNVRHHTGYARGSGAAERRDTALAQYAEAIRAAGWHVTGPEHDELTVTAAGE